MSRLAGLVSLLVAGVASAQYLRTEVEDAGHPLCVTWTKRSFTYQVDASGSAKTPGSTELQAIEAAFASWQKVSDACSDFTFTRGPDSTARLTGKRTTAENTVIWRERSCVGVVPDDDACWLKENDDCSSVYDCWSYGLGVLALTTVTHSSRTGAIYDADIELDGSGQLFTTVDSPPCPDDALSTGCVATDVQNTMTHEIGHAMGFAHVLNESSTMFAFAFPGELSKRVIDPGTVEGFCATYPRGGPPLPCDALDQAKRRIVGRGAGTSGCASAEALPLLLAALLLLRRRE